MHDGITFGRWLRDQRRALDLTQNELARRIGCARITIRKIEADDMRPSKQLALLLAEHLNVQAAERDEFIKFARAESKTAPFIQSSLREKAAPWRTGSLFVLDNLPVPLSDFIGREQEIEQVKETLAHSRLVTLTGSGGVGKTRLALQVGKNLLGAFADGVWYIELAPLTDPGLVPNAAAKVMGVREESGLALMAALTDWLRAKRLLLILDNCDHLIEACARFTEALLEQCPNLRILATSREALDIPGERVWIVPSLHFPIVAPSRGDAGSVESRMLRLASKMAPDLLRYDAVRLFVERAGAVHPTFKLTPQNAGSVAYICQRLDGIPLAIELAAARIKVLSIEQIAARLDDSLQLLAGGKRTAPQRHQTLHAAMDWSYSLLSPNEQRLFRRLAVFAGGFTLTAAEIVCMDDGLKSEDALDLLSQLVSKSLVIKQEQAGEARYRLLEPIRQFALRKLDDAGESPRVRERHLDFFFKLARHAGTQSSRTQREVWLPRFEAEHDNLRAALEWSKTTRVDAALGLRMACALFWFWSYQGYFAEGRGWLEAAHAHAGRSGSSFASNDEIALEAEALYAEGWLTHGMGGHVAAKPLLEQSVNLWRSHISLDKSGLARALVALGRSWRIAGEPMPARQVTEEAVVLFRAEGDQEKLAHALIELGMEIRDHQEFLLARRSIEESLTIYRALGDEKGISDALFFLGSVAYRQGQYAAAFKSFKESLNKVRKLGYKSRAAYALHNLGFVSLCLGKEASAKRYLEESEALFRELGDEAGVVLSLIYDARLALLRGDITQAASFYSEGFALALKGVGPLWTRGQYLFGWAAIAALQGQWELAARLRGAAEKQTAAAASFWDAADRRLYELTVAKARDRLGELGFEAARTAGMALTLEQAVAEAEQVSTAEAMKLIQPDSTVREVGGLTPREGEVLRLVARGLSDARIAAQLVISPRTVNAHLTAIYSKLGVNSRSAAMRYALDQDLV